MELIATHLGTATLLLEVGPFRLLTDPVFDPPGRAYAVLGLASYRRLAPATQPPPLDRLDAVLLSHDHHGDNLDERGLAAARAASCILTTRAGARRLGGAARGLAPWMTHELMAADGQRLRVTATPARHASPSLLAPLAGPVIGFLLEWEGQPRGATWVSGDTVLFEGVREVARRHRVATAFLHVGRASPRFTAGAHFTFTAAEAAETAALLGDAEVIPVHYEGWSHFKEGRADVERAFAARGLAGRLRWLPPGAAVPLGG